MSVPDVCPHVCTPVDTHVCVQACRTADENEAATMHEEALELQLASGLMMLIITYEGIDNACKVCKGRIDDANITIASKGVD